MVAEAVTDASSRVLLGIITGAHGIRGRLRIKSFTANPADLDSYGPLQDKNGKTFQLKISSETKGVLIAHCEGVKDRNAAEALKGTELYLPRAALPALRAEQSGDDETDDEEGFYHVDLIGLLAERVPDETGAVEALGQIIAVHDFGAGDVLEVKTPADGPFKGRTVLVPFTRQIVPTVDLAAGKIVVDAPAGLLEAQAPGGGRNPDDGQEDHLADSEEETA